MTRRAVHLRRGDWARDAVLDRGRFEGRDIGTGVTVLFYATEDVGAGAALHVHPYDEVFILRRGRARYRIGDETIEAEAGDIVLGPANVPHKFENLGPEPLETIDIHLSDRWIQTDLEEPDRAGGRS